MSVSLVIPAYNEAKYIVQTLAYIKKLGEKDTELIVVDDGSTDETASLARKMADQLICLRENHGKGFALQAGWQSAKGEYIVCLDADLEKSALEYVELLKPVKAQQTDICLSIIQPGKKAGNGFVKKRVQKLIYQQTGMWLEAPLSGQRAFHRKWLPILLKQHYEGFAVEAQMTIDLLKAGASIFELQTTMTHREMGKSLKGYTHRLKQWWQIEKQLRSVRV
ncbi:glycosyltransferase family 2 protein [Halalkalibacter hemicellulosilyticus]|uniref:Glucosyl-3-phosphoglycerate synthase n=1 Tax=Halalkalibacter hemicellulosilyticusJCM 9152 TaxID=1236971 RepID=W4QJ11_9BACI|nr:glycosyltransferase family 2 protein [Halalkalibacter hemicellulosilyticus]GAE31897.1 glycosyltransferase [Halalkalibacter hemicellulosilyticusJCM 9152]